MEDGMIVRNAIGTILAGALLAVPAVADATEQVEVIGKKEFVKNCAACHGPEGKGNGPVAQYLKTAPPSLTTLKRRNEGEFPLERVYNIIDGRIEVRGHGSREMPVWGEIYRFEGTANFGPFLSEDYVRGRILELVFYVNSIQE